MLQLTLQTKLNLLHTILGSTLVCPQHRTFLLFILGHLHLSLQPLWLLPLKGALVVMLSSGLSVPKYLSTLVLCDFAEIRYSGAYQVYWICGCWKSCNEEETSSPSRIRLSPFCQSIQKHLFYYGKNPFPPEDTWPRFEAPSMCAEGDRCRVIQHRCVCPSD